MNSNPVHTPATNATFSAAPLEAEPAPADLVVEAGAEVQGGPMGSTGWGGSTRPNHNKTEAKDDEAETDLPDLPPPAIDEVKGGPLGSEGWGGSTRLNHNQLLILDDSM